MDKCCKIVIRTSIPVDYLSHHILRDPGTFRHTTLDRKSLHEVPVGVGLQGVSSVYRQDFDNNSV